MSIWTRPLVDVEVKGGLLLFADRKLLNDEMDLIKTLSGDLAFAIRAIEVDEAKRRAYEQLAKNVAQMALLVDRIRNPLAAAKSYAELLIEDENAKKKILEQINRIVELVEQLEKGWVKSETIREFLKRERALDD